MSTQIRTSLNKNLTSLLMAAAVTLIAPKAGMAGELFNSYGGNSCTAINANHAQWAAYGSQGNIYNTSPTQAIFVTCPITRGKGWSVWEYWAVKVHDQHSNRNVSCTLTDIEAGFRSGKRNLVNGVYTLMSNGQGYQNLNLFNPDTDSNSISGIYSVRCSIPPKQGSKISSLLHYTVIQED